MILPSSFSQSFCTLKIFHILSNVAHATMRFLPIVFIDTFQENAVGLLENMTNFITSQLSAEAQDIDLVQDIGGNLLQGMSNSLSTSAKKAVVNEEQSTGIDKIENIHVDTVEMKRKQVLIIVTLTIIITAVFRKGYKFKYS